MVTNAATLSGARVPNDATKSHICTDDVLAGMEHLSEGKTQMTTKIRLLPIKAIGILLLFAIDPYAQAGNTKWEIVLNQSLADDEAIKVVLADLENIGRQCDYQFDYPQRQNAAPANVVLLGNAAGIASTIE